MINEKNLYLYFRNIYDYQTWQNGNLRWRDSNFNVMWHSDYVVTWQMKKKLYLNFHNTYCQQTLQSGNLRSYNHTLSYMAFWSHGHVINVKPYICISVVLMTTKLGRVITCRRGTQPSKSRDHLITWSRDKWKKLCHTYSIPLATKFGGWRTQPIKSWDRLITWSRDNLKKLLSAFQ